MSYRLSKDKPGTNRRDCPHYQYHLMGRCNLDRKLEPGCTICVGTKLCDIFWDWFLKGNNLKEGEVCQP